MQDRLSQTVAAIPQSGIRRIAELARRVPGCISLALGEPAFGTPSPIREAAKAALDRGETHYGPNAGLGGLRDAVAGFESRHYPRPLSPEHVLITCGSTEALACAFLSVLQADDEVIVPVPAFGLYAQQIQLARGRFVPLRTAASGFQIDEAALTACVTPRTKAVVVNSPNNPTGVQYTQASMDAVTRLCVRHNLFLLYDAVYDRLTYAPPVPQPDAGALGGRLIRINAFSKPYAMTGWRIGYCIAAPDILQALTRVHAALTVGAATFSQAACLDIFDIPIRAMVDAYRQNRDDAYARLCRMGLPTVRPDGAFYIFPRTDGLGIDDETLAARLVHEAGVAVVPGSCFGAPGFVRISTCGAPDDLAEGLNRLERFLQDMK